jgi:serine/threonine protein kinase
MEVQQFKPVAGAFLPPSQPGAPGYIIESCLGEGGYGVVYKVREQPGDTVRALKMLKLWEIPPKERQEVRLRFEREYNCGKSDSTFLVRTYDAGEGLGNPYFTMDFCAGGNLRERMQKRDYTTAEAAEWGLQVLRGLLALHQNGIIHRDMKPENVLLDVAGHAKVTDFGIAGFTNARITKTFLGIVKQLMGTELYMPPEQRDRFQAFKAMGFVTDIYAFGVMQYELMTFGYFPFADVQGIDQLENHFLSASGRTDYATRKDKGQWYPAESRNPEISAMWRQVLEGCLQPNPRQRLQHVQHILDMLESGGRYNAQEAAQRRAQARQPFFNALRVMHGDGVNKLYMLSREPGGQPFKGIFTIGRLDDGHPNQNDIEILELGQPYVSRQHATLEYDAATGWFLRDGQWRAAQNAWHPSTNGTLINGDSIGVQGGQVFRDDILTLGDTTLRAELV